MAPARDFGYYGAPGIYLGYRGTPLCRTAPKTARD